MEPLKHECGIAMVRLLKPLEYYKDKYGTDKYALSKLYLMMEKQHNRGQEGAGMACVRLNGQPGHEYMYREKAEGKDAITKVFANVYRQMAGYCPDGPAEITTTDDIPGEKPPFIGELYMGHLRYSTTGRGGLKYVHPFLRRNNWKAKNLCLCGNFNMTNIGEVFNHLTAQGQSPRVFSDSYIMLEIMGHRLDREVERLFVEAQKQGLSGMEITSYIDSHVDIANVLKTTMPLFDGGYVVCGLTGSGEFFAMRDPHGIRPAFYYINDEVVTCASERPVLQTTFDVSTEEVHELLPGQAIIVRASGETVVKQIMNPLEYLPCSFERIYFSRGNDLDIYNERKALGHQLVDKILETVEDDTENTVFSYIPNTAEVAYYGLIEGMEEHTPRVRAEKVVSKDIKLRTFIAESGVRNDLAAHVYDITFGSITPFTDNLVVIDDSIVRGTTLRESIIKILDRLHPKKMVIVSSAPQIRYPDFYGIDMSRIGDFIAFQACVDLHHDRHSDDILRKVYEECRTMLAENRISTANNPVRRIYEPFSADELSEKMVEILRPAGMTTPLSLVFQSIEGLHQAIPNHPGDWYFSGHYPTPGGLRLLLLSYVEWYEKQQS